MKRIIGLIAVFAVVASVAAFAEGQQQTGQIKLTWSTASVPGDAHTEAIPAFKAELEKLSDGTMTVEYYHSGQLFSQANDQDACMQGKVDMVYSSASWLAQHVPTASMFGAAFTFQSYNQMTKTLNGPIGQKIFDQAVAKLGMRPLMAYYLGTRQLNLTEKVGPVTKPEQMKNVKFRVPNAPRGSRWARPSGRTPRRWPSAKSTWASRRASSTGRTTRCRRTRTPSSTRSPSTSSSPTTSSTPCGRR